MRFHRALQMLRHSLLPRWSVADLLAQMRGYAPHEERARASVPFKALISVLDELHHPLLLFCESLLCI